MASAKAIAKIAIVWIFDAASGFLEIDLTAEEPIQPIEIAGHIVPNAIAPAVINKRIESISMVISLFNNIYLNLSLTSCIILSIIQSNLLLKSDSSIISWKYGVLKQWLVPNGSYLEYSTSIKILLDAYSSNSRYQLILDDIDY